MYIDKNEVRSSIKKKCMSIDDHYRIWASAQILNYARAMLDRAKTIGVYRASSWEINLQEVINYALSLDKLIYQPIAFKNSKNMLLDTYVAENSAIFYPEDYKPKSLEKWYNLDLIFIPLVAVDLNGNRLGKGGGYYDTTLLEVVNQEQRPILCGVGFNCQFLSEPLIVDHWDISLDCFISEVGMIEF